MKMDDQDDITFAIPLFIRRCSNPECNAILRRGNQGDYCWTCAHKANMKGIENNGQRDWN